MIRKKPNSHSYWDLIKSACKSEAGMMYSYHHQAWSICRRTNRIVACYPKRRDIPTVFKAKVIWKTPWSRFGITVPSQDFWAVLSKSWLNRVISGHWLWLFSHFIDLSFLHHALYVIFTSGSFISCSDSLLHLSDLSNLSSFSDSCLHAPLMWSLHTRLGWGAKSPTVLA